MNEIICGDLNFSIPSHMNYGKLVIDRMLKSKENIALIDGATGEETKYGEMVQAIVNSAVSLMRLGVKRGDVAAICSENRKEVLITAIALWCSGATVTFLNFAYSKDELLHSMKISRPNIAFISPAAYEKFYKTMRNINLINKFYMYGNSIKDTQLAKFDELTKTYVDVHSFRPQIDINGLSKTALILYSSGTTGLPKGAKLTHLNLITAANQPCNLSKTRITLTVTPWSNTVGIILTLDELTNNSTVVYLERLKEDQYLSCIQKFKVEQLLMVPPLIVMLTQSQILKNYDVSSVEIMYSGGAALDLATMNEAKKKFPNLKHLLQGYGMTETTGALSEETEEFNRPGSIGRVVLGNIVKIRDIHTGKTLGPNQKGELCIKGPVLFGGYIGKNITDDLDEDGFFKTGDIVYYDKDGYFFFVDRIKELIKYKAGQVAPTELETILLHHPGVKDAAVTGKPDRIAGELPTAFVIRKQDSEVTANELIDFVASRVSSWKQLRGGVYFVESIPKTPSGKILRRILRDNLKKVSSKL